VNYQFDWFIERIFLGPAYDEFLQIIIQILLVKRGRIDRVEELVQVLKVHLDGIFASRR